MVCQDQNRVEQGQLTRGIPKGARGNQTTNQSHRKLTIRALLLFPPPAALAVGAGAGDWAGVGAGGVLVGPPRSLRRSSRASTAFSGLAGSFFSSTTAAAGAGAARAPSCSAAVAGEAGRGFSAIILSVGASDGARLRATHVMCDVHRVRRSERKLTEESTYEVLPDCTLRILRLLPSQKSESYPLRLGRCY